MPGLRFNLISPFLSTVIKSSICSVIFSGLFSGIGAAACAAEPVSASAPALTPTRIVIPLSNSKDINHEDYYFSQLLKLALHKTENLSGPYQLAESNFFYVDKRLRTALVQGKIDVLWSPAGHESETRMLRVPVSLLKDLNNYRIFLIRKDDQSRFSNIKSLDDLRKLKGGVGAQWTDAAVMRENNLPRVEAVGYGKLFKMLAAGRFDYFSRGLYQVQSETNFYPELELQIEQELMLHYPNEFYFYVNKNNPALAKRLETGLNIAQTDGSFDELFNSIPRYRWALELLQNNKRRVLDLATPLNIGELGGVGSE